MLVTEPRNRCSTESPRTTCLFVLLFLAAMARGSTAPVIPDGTVLCDVIFSFFAQGPTSMAQYESAIAVAGGISSDRVTLQAIGGQVGFFFGANFRVRVQIGPSLKTSNGTTTTVSAEDARNALISAAENGTTLSEIGILSVEPVDSLVIFQYPVVASLDVAWEGLIVFVGVAFGCFSVFVLLQLHSKTVKGGLSAGAPTARHHHHAEGVTPPALSHITHHAEEHHPDPAKAVLPDPGVLEVPAGPPNPASTLTRTIAASGRRAPLDDLATESAFTAPTERRPLPLANIGVPSLRGRELALHVDEERLRVPAESDVRAYLAAVTLPPRGAPVSEQRLLNPISRRFEPGRAGADI